MSPLIFAVIFTNLPLFIYPVRADRAHWRFISNTLLFAHAASHTDTQALHSPATTINDRFAERLGVGSLLLAGITTVSAEGRKSVTHSLPPVGLFLQKEWRMGVSSLSFWPHPPSQL